MLDHWTRRSPKITFSVFGHDGAVRVLHAFMRFSVSSFAFSSHSGVVEGTIANLHSWALSWPLQLLAFERLAQRRLVAIGKRCMDKPFQQFFQSLPPSWPNKNGGVRWRLVPRWADSFLTVNTQTIKSGFMSVPEQSYGGNVYFISPQASRCGIAPEVFEYITFYTDTSHDCYVLDFDSTKRKLVLIGAYLNTTDMDERLQNIRQ